MVPPDSSVPSDLPAAASDSASLSPEQEDALRRRGLLDLAARTRPGIFIYALAWFVVAQGGGFFGQHTAFVLWNTAGLLAVGIVRLLAHRRLGLLVEADAARAGRLFRSAVLLHGLHWGVLLAATITWPAAEGMRAYMIPMSVAMVMAGTIVVAIDQPLSRVYPLATIAPVVIVLLSQPSAANAVFAVLGVGFMAYAWVISRVLRRDYDDAQRARVLLENRARELELVSLTDALTQVPNRLQLDRRLPVEWLQARRAKRPLAVALVDLDHFKRINDRYGHPFGDRCLREAAAALREELLRPSDMVARYGGEEFLVLLPETDLAGAAAVAERMRQRVAARALQHEGQPVRLSCSIGISACVPASAADGAQRLVQRADEALYRAKAEGRDRVVALPHEAA